MNDEPLRVMRPNPPPIERMRPYLERIWRSSKLTNGGPLHDELEAAISERLDGAHVSLCANGTIALMLALRAVVDGGSVVTSPFGFLATANAIRWAGLTPVFCDVDPETLNLSPARVEEVMDDEVAAILPVHCYGMPCDLDAFESLSRRHDVPVVYDAAHAFGVSHEGRALAAEGTCSALSFHATKVFSTVEGGAVVSRTRDIKARVDRLRNFGLGEGGTAIQGGLNGKLSELHAAYGLAQLEQLDAELVRRRALAERYRARLSTVAGIRVMHPGTGVVENGAYFPILVEPEFPLERDVLHDHLGARGIGTRKYFHPLLTDASVDSEGHLRALGTLDVACEAASQILCLPIAGAYETSVADRVSDAIAAVADVR